MIFWLEYGWGGAVAPWRTYGQRSFVMIDADY